jgi:hypothetical protein
VRWSYRETVFISKQFSDIVCWRAIFVGKIIFVGKLGLEVFWEGGVISPSRLIEPFAEKADCFKCEIQHLRRRDLDDLFARRHSAKVRLFDGIAARKRVK